MKYFSSILFIGCFITLSAQEAPTQEKFLEIVKAENRAHQSLKTQKTTNVISDYDIIYYQCHWQIDPDSNYISGSVKSYFKPITSNFDTVLFNLHDTLNVDSVLYHGNKISYNHSGGIISAILPSSVAINQLDSITVFYQGAPSGSGLGSFITDTHNGTPVLWTLSQPYGASDWWPCKNGLSDKVDSTDVFITTPKAYRAASNGILQSEIINGNNKTVHWKHRYPIVSYLICLATTNYAEFTHYLPHGTDSIPILHYVYPEDSAQIYGPSQNIIPIMQIFDSIFGEYPFAKEQYGHCQFGWGGGMEHQTFSFMGNFDFGLQAHEVAHQWFGNKVTCGSWTDIWLNEGFATYLTGLVYENVLNGLFWNVWLEGTLSDITSQPDGSVYCSDTTDVNRIFDPRLSYHKGAMILHQLRWVLGDSAFFAGCTNYLNDTNLSYNFATTDDLINHFEISSGQNLQWYFNDWFYGEGFPSFTVNWTHANDTLKLSVSQSQSHSSVNFFELPIPYHLYGNNLDTSLRLNITQNNQDFKFYIPQSIDSTKFDPNLWLISANNHNISISEEEQLENWVDVAPNPATDYITIKFNQNYNDAVITLLNENGQLLHSMESSDPIIEYNINRYPTGTYLLKLSIDGHTIIKKVLIIK